MRKRLPAALISVALLLTLAFNTCIPSMGADTGTSPVSSDLLSPGDLNGDGSVDLGDVVLLLQHVLFPDLYPLAAAETSGERYIYKHVVILGVDGGGAFFEQADTPNLDRIFENGSVTYEAQCMYPSISAQCWGSMLHGVLPDYHGLPNGSDAPYPSDSIFPSIFRVVREADPSCSLASFNNWTEINRTILEDGLGIYMDSGSDGVETDKIVAYLEYNQPKLMFVQFDSPDVAGAKGWGSQYYLDTMHTVDSYIGRIYDKMVETGMMEDTLLIVAPDHGGTYLVQPDGTVTGGHGGKSPSEMTIMIAVTGKTVLKGRMGEADTRDIASIVLYALGLDQPDTYTGRIPDGVFPGVEGMERPVYTPPHVVRYAHEGEPTPADGSGKTLFDYVGRNSVAMYMPLDGNVHDAVGTYTVSPVGSLSFTDGYYGQGVSVAEGSIMTGFSPGTSSFSVSCWMNITIYDSDPSIFGNKLWTSGYNRGFVVAYRGKDIKFNLGDGSRRMDVSFDLPSDPFKNGWMPLIFVVDREAGTVGMSVDFGDLQVYEIPDEMKNVSFSTPYGMNFGQDGTGVYPVQLPASLDELVIYSRALTSADIAGLKAYYQGDRAN